MDVLSLDLGVPASMTELPQTEHGLGRVARPRSELLAELARRSAGGAGGAAGMRRRGLLAYTSASIVAGISLLAWTTATIPVGPAIDPGLAETAVAGPVGGLLLWITFGLLGSLRVLRAPGGGGFLTFHLPFIAAAMVLGGPTAGAWVAFLSTIERRELESQPWYGILANHSVMVIAAVAGGLVTSVVAHGGGVPFHAGGDVLVASVAGTLVVAVVTTAMAALTVILRDDLGPREGIDLILGQFGRMTAIEIGLAWVLILAYLEVGWWSPLATGVFVLLLWDNDPLPPPDAMTGLLTAKGFGRRMETGIGRMRRGLVPGATLMSIDLDFFKTVNDRYGHAVGDEVLAEIGVRLRAQARRPADLAGRMGGDELALFLTGLADDDIAMRRADEVVATITAPIATTVGPVSVGVSVGVLVVASWGGIPSAGTMLRHADQAMFHAKRAGGGAHRYDAGETTPFEQSWLEARR
jgi:diguanylate cyclase (GGDEF)-like protein